jgi:phosphoribosylformylglycinamidine synthase subunit PurSL
MKPTAIRRELQQDSSTLSEMCVAVVPRGGFQPSRQPVRFPIYWIEFTDKDQSLEAALTEVLTDPLLSELWMTGDANRGDWLKAWHAQAFQFFAEKQHQPGVTDNLAKTVEEALQLAGVTERVQVASGEGMLYPESTDLTAEEIEHRARYRFFHPLTERFCIHKVDGSQEQAFLRFPEVHLPAPEPPKYIALDVTDEQLLALSKSRILALTLDEMQAIKKHFEQPQVTSERAKQGLEKWPTDVELEVIAQTWSEHCKHKIFSARVHYQNGDTGERTEINSLYKTYIQDATRKLSEVRPDLLSVFEDNAGVVRWNDDWAVCFKVETHNSPSALEPYGGALTGILGVNRDILGTGLGARPIFNTDVFCFAFPSEDLPNRPTMLPPEVIIHGVRQGVQDGGNKSGIPTVNGGLYFHPGYRAKPLVYCGTGGLLPLQVGDKVGYKKYTTVGDTIVMAGGRVGKDGIHGATFSSEALHEGSPVSAVQIGDPFTQKRLLDFVLEARDRGLITGITDNGAGGLSSSVGEMAQLTGGAALELAGIPLKYAGLADYEIVISESQERMSISTRDFKALKELAESFNVEVTACGTFTDDGYFAITRNGKPVALLDLNFLHKGCPQLQLEARWDTPSSPEPDAKLDLDLNETLLALLSRPNICSREAIIRQYDHEVQGTSVIKPLMGPRQIAPCDAAVIKPLPDGAAGLVISNGICPQLSQYDTYLMAVCAVDEAVRNAVCVGADPDSISLLDNFCWTDPVPSPRNTEAVHKMAQLVRACQGLYDAVLAYGAPLISGKDSMKNDFDDGLVRLSIPPTLLVSSIGRISHCAKAVTMDFKRPGDIVYLLSAGTLGLGGSEVASLGGLSAGRPPAIDLPAAAIIYRGIHEWITAGGIKSAHDCSEGGLAVALAECVIGSGLGITIDQQAIDQILLPYRDQTTAFALFTERPATIVLTVSPADAAGFESDFKELCPIRLGEVTADGVISLEDNSLRLDHKSLVAAWSWPLPLEDEGHQ